MSILQPDKIFIGASSKPEYLGLPFANRHGLITGATGTGKTVTLQILAEGFSRAGVPVFCADVKGDVAGLAAAGVAKDFLHKRAAKIGFTADYEFTAFPVELWDLFGRQGHPIRTTLSEVGPLLLSRLMNLTDAQEGVLNIAFRVADKEGLLLLDLKDLQALLTHVAERARELSARYGNVSRASVGAVQRKLLVLEVQGAEEFYGEPALDISELMRTTHDGRGVINVLDAGTLMESPRLYATFLLWLLSELFEELPEVGDPEKPSLVFFFDEAHLLFNEAPKALLEKVNQVVRLIRSKGVSVFFVTQNPRDVPDSVLSQLGNRIQHALRAYTPREVRAVKAAADTFRPNPEFSAFDVITQLGVGEALVSTLDAKGVPSMVQRTLIRPPSSRIGTLTGKERKQVLAASTIGAQYDQPIDRNSAFEVLQRRVEARAAAETRTRADTRAKTGRTPSRRREPSIGDALEDMIGDAAEKLGRDLGGPTAGRLGRSIIRGILGGILRR
jgi:DNA helicase HerA-like ATPase